MQIDPSRRSFLAKMAGGIAVFPASALARSGSFSLFSSVDEGSSYWELVRQQFPFHEDRVPMNAANLCPSPRMVAEQVSELTRDIDIDCSFQNRSKFHDLQESSRRKVAEHLGVSPEEIALVRNTSEANNTVNNGLALSTGDEIVLWDQNHPTNNVAWDVRAARFGLVVKRVSTPEHPESIQQLVDVFEKAFGPKSRVLAITHVSNVSGIRLPARELTEAAHRRGIHVHLDGAQTWGSLDVNLREIGCDSYSASAHKWFVGPKEVGVLYVREDRIPHIWPNVVAPGWGDDVEPDVKGARKFESLGQRDDATLAAVGTTVDFHQMVGPQRIEHRVQELASLLKGELKELGVSLVTPEEPELSGGVCIIEVRKENRGPMVDRLYREHGIAAAPTGGLRLCPHLYNTREHVERAVAGVRALRSLLV